MSARDRWQPMSLAQRFDAPDGFRGEFGWVCGFSADAAFLNDAAERFTRLTQAQRAHEGRIRIALFLDPCNPQIRLSDAPGVAHLPIAAGASRPFRLFHAKVALLAFREEGGGGGWRLRLVVSTGNWTRQTLEDSLDLAWCLELDNDGLLDAQGAAQACADMRAAWRLFDWIATQFDTRLLDAGGELGAKASRGTVATWIEACDKRARGVPRLLDNRKRPLWREIQSRLAKHDRPVARNYLAMGSGFYEADKEKNEAVIPRQLVEELMADRLLTKSCQVDLYVNPLACQSIAQSVESLKQHLPPIVVRPAATPEAIFGDARPRGLHAKFLFSANRREDSNAYSSPWVYLGSGNLTEAGFRRAAARFQGNFEAGVLLFPEGIERCARKGLDGNRVITHLLPIQWERAFTEQGDLRAGEAWSPPEQEFLAPPTSYFSWHEDANGNATELRPAGGLAIGVDVLDGAGHPCMRTATGFLWQGAMPRSVQVTWEDGRHQADVPVVDSFGRLGGTALPKIGLEEAWWQLADFPMPPEADSQEEGSDIAGAAEAPLQGSGNEIAEATPIRQMMQLVENIAARQTTVPPADWPLWCARLEQTLGQAKDSSPVEAFKALGINPLSPLHAAPFRPSYAEQGDTEAGRLYEQALARIESNWAVSQLSKLGALA